MRISDWSSDVCSSDLVTLADSGALTDPLVRRVDACRQLIIGHNARGKIRPAAQDDRPSHSYDTAAFLFSRSAARRSKSSLIFFMKPWAAMSMATQTALAKPSDRRSVV